MRRATRLGALVALPLVLALSNACGGGGPNDLSPERPVTSVTVDQSSLNLQSGDDGSLTVTLSNAPGARVTWTSSAPAVADVSNCSGTSCKVRAGAAGTATIEIVVTTSGGQTARASVPVTVKARPTVTAIQVTPSTQSVEVGQTARLAAQVTSDPGVDQTVQWRSSDPTVATVDAKIGRAHV